MIAAFYARVPSGIPRAWVERMRESMAQLTPLVSTNRTVREYTEGVYLSAAAAYGKRAADKGAGGSDRRGDNRRISRMGVVRGP